MYMVWNSWYGIMYIHGMKEVCYSTWCGVGKVHGVEGWEERVAGGDPPRPTCRAH